MAVDLRVEIGSSAGGFSSSAAVDLTRAVVDWPPVVYRAITSSDMAVNLVVEVAFWLPRLENEIGLTARELKALLDERPLRISFVVDGAAVVSWGLAARDYTWSSDLMINDKLSITCVTWGFRIAENQDIGAVVAEALSRFHLPADLGALVPWAAVYRHAAAARYPSLSGGGVHLTEWPGYLVSSGAVAETGRRETALVSTGAFDGPSVFGFRGQPRRLGGAIYLGERVESYAGLVGGLVVAAPADGADQYAISTIDWPALEYPGGYPAGLAKTCSVTKSGGGFAVLLHWPRELVGGYTVRSRAMYLSRCDVDSDYRDSDHDGAFGYFQAGQVVGSAIPPIEPNRFKRYQAKCSSYYETRIDRRPGSETYGEYIRYYIVSKLMRERLFIAEAPDAFLDEDMIPIIDPRYKIWKYQTDNDTGAEGYGYSGPPLFRRNIYLPYRSQVDYEYQSDGAGQSPPVVAYRRDRPVGWREGGTEDAEPLSPGPCDVAGYTRIGELPQVLEPGWYAFGAWGAAVKADRNTHPTEAPGGPARWSGGRAPHWGTKSGFMNESRNKVNSYELTISPLGPVSNCQRSAVVDGVLYFDAAPGSGDYQRPWPPAGGRPRSLAIVDLSTSAVSYEVAPDGLWDRLFVAIDGYLWRASVRYTLPSGWAGPAGVAPRIPVVEVARGVGANRLRWSILGLGTAAEGRPLELISAGLEDYRVTMITDDGAGGLLIGVQVRKRDAVEIDEPVRRASWYLDDPGDGGDEVEVPGVKYTWTGYGGTVELGGDHSSALAEDDRVVLYVPAYRRHPAAPATPVYPAPVEMRVVSVSYSEDDDITLVEVDPHPSLAAASDSDRLATPDTAIQYWDADDDHDYGGGAALGSDPAARLYRLGGWTPWATRLYRVPAAALGTLSTGGAVRDASGQMDLVAAPTKTVRTAGELSWDGEQQGYVLELGAQGIDLAGELVCKDETGRRLAAAFVRGEAGETRAVMPYFPGEITAEYQVYDGDPYRRAGAYIYQGGRVYRFTAGALVDVFPAERSFAGDVIGDAVEAGALTYIPIWYGDGPRIIVVSPHVRLTGLATKPRSDVSAATPVSKLLDIPRAFGLVADRRGTTWSFRGIPGGAAGAVGSPAPPAEIDEEYILDLWTEANWSGKGGRPPGVRYGDDDFYSPASYLSASPVDNAEDARNWAVNSADAAAAWLRARLFFSNPSDTLIAMTLRMTAESAIFIGGVGQLFTVPIPPPLLGSGAVTSTLIKRPAILIEAVPDAEEGIMTLHFLPLPTEV
jgi:hypothetical protein